MYTAQQIKEMIEQGNVEAFYNDRYWRALSAQIIKEYHGECIMCKEAHKLTPATLVHHVNHLKDAPHLAYRRTFTAQDGTEQMQLMPLCHDCHEKVHERGIYAKPSGYVNEERW